MTSHVDVRLSAPMSSSALGPLTAPSAQSIRQPAVPSKADVGPQPQRPAHGPQTQSGPVSKHAARIRSCVVADGIVVQSGHPAWMSRTSQAHTRHGQRRTHVATPPAAGPSRGSRAAQGPRALRVRVQGPRALACRSALVLLACCLLHGRYACAFPLGSAAGRRTRMRAGSGPEERRDA
jgi:hypothetical protein